MVVLTQLFGLRCDLDLDFSSALVLLGKRGGHGALQFTLEFIQLPHLVYSMTQLLWQLEIGGCSLQVRTEVLSAFVEMSVTAVPSEHIPRLVQDQCVIIVYK